MDKSFGEFINERYVVDDFTGHLAVLLDSSLPHEDCGHSMSFLKRLYDDCVEYLREDNVFYYRLNDTQFNALQKIATLSQMDTWFDLRSDAKGDYIYDLEENETTKFKQGIQNLLEGTIEEDWCKLSEEEQRATLELAKLFGIECYELEDLTNFSDKTYLLENHSVYIQINSDGDFDYTIHDKNGLHLDGGIIENNNNYHNIHPSIIKEIKMMHDL